MDMPNFASFCENRQGNNRKWTGQRLGDYVCSGGNASCNNVGCGWCSTQAEADSVKCVLNPQAEGCIVEVDTTLFACSDLGSGNSAIYRLDCKAQGGSVTSCAGKTNVNVMTDGTKVRDMSGTCAQNGYESGIVGGDSIPPAANAECFAVFGSTCHMRDKNSGNTFTCDCDGSCNIALQNLMAGSANCTNPYPQPNEGGDSLSFPSSSDSGLPESSAAPEPQSSPSFGNEQEALNSLYGVLDTIRDTLVKDIAPNVRDIRANTQGMWTTMGNIWEENVNISSKLTWTNDYLQQIANKDWEPTINVAAPEVHVAAPNVNVQVDTAKAPKGILDFLTAPFQAPDTSGSGAWLDSAKGWGSGLLGKADSLLGEAGNIPDMADSMSGAQNGLRSAFTALGDSLENSAVADSFSRWTGLITNNGVITGDGADACPEILQRKWNVEIGAVHTEWGPLGKYVCASVFGGVTGWALIRAILRLAVSIACMLWIYKSVMGITAESEDE